MAVETILFQKLKKITEKTKQKEVKGVYNTKPVSGRLQKMLGM